MPSAEFPPRRSVAAAGSALLPGLGHALQGHVAYGLVRVGTALALAGACWAVERAGGVGAGIFAFLMFVLPWWMLQAYEAWLIVPGATPIGLGAAMRLAWERAHDLHFLGILFLITAATDFYIIAANPSYSLTVFCQKPSGVMGMLAKAQSPTLHVLIGYGFLRLRRWSFYVYLAYAGFGLLNAAANYGCFGYGRIRTVFFISLVAFTIYVVARRHRLTT